MIGDQAPILQALVACRVRGKRYPAGALISPPPKRGAALVAAGTAREVATVERPADLAFLVRLRKRWTSGRGRTYGPLQVVRIGWRELQERPAVVEVLEILEDGGADRPAAALPGRPPSKLARAAEWLRMELEACGGSARVAEILPRAGRARIRPRTLQRARKAIGAKAVRRERVTWWTLGSDRR